jgi:molybdopterin converting factor small subunit
MSTVVLPGVLREHAGGVSTIEVPGGCSLGDLLDGLAESHPYLVRRIRDEQGELRRFVNVYVDDEDVRRMQGLATQVPAGAEVRVLPSVAGGSPGAAVSRSPLR